MFRQGDILLLPIADTAVPTSIESLATKPRDARGRLVLALGEVTGHAHAIPGAATLYPSPDPMLIGHLRIPQETRIVHEEHAEIALPKGWYRVIRQREYLPGAVRMVAD